jgi:hypothetical protein
LQLIQAEHFFPQRQESRISLLESNETTRVCELQKLKERPIKTRSFRLNTQGSVKGQSNSYVAKAQKRNEIQAEHTFIWIEPSQPCRAESMPGSLVWSNPCYNANGQMNLIWVYQWG